MEILSFLASARLNRRFYQPRKTALTAKRTALVGSPRSGKSSFLIGEALRLEREFLYLNLCDDRVSIEAVAAELPAYLAAHKNALLAIDNYDDRLALPENAEAIWLTLKKPRAIAGFETKRLLAPDFEEFLAHSGKSEPQAAFDEFLRSGALFELWRLDETERIKRSQEILRLLCDTAQKRAIFSWFLQRSAYPLTPHQAYEALKPKIAVSKDGVYSYIAELAETMALFTTAKFGAPKAPRKFYPCDHALREAVSFDRALSKTLETMAALELIKRGRTPFYADGIDLYLAEENRAVIALPIASEAKMAERIAKFDPKIKPDRIEFVTTGFAGAIGEQIDAAPFWEWALRESE